MEDPPSTAVKARVLGIMHSIVAWVATQAARAIRVAKRLPGTVATFFASLGDRCFTLRGLFGFTVRVFLVVFIAICVLVFVLVHFGTSKVPGFDPVSEIVYLDQGWGAGREAKDRQDFYFTPQGTSLKGLRYSWFVNLERRKDRVHFASADNMRAFGFVVDLARTKKNRDQLPVGFTRHWDLQLQDEVLDITCAACHTGQINVMQNGRPIGIRIDGGPAMHAFTDMSIGHFLPELISSMAVTYLDPPTFYRFARGVLGATFPHGWFKLHSDLGDVLWVFLKQGGTDLGKHLYPIQEGFGRTDAIGRIANTVFGEHIADENYHIGNAPVSYPPLWDIYKFDWVQYGASVRHPLARNVGESMGVGSTYELVDPYGGFVPAAERFAASSLINEISWIEDGLQKLQPPRWPEDLLGPIDCQKAMAGKYLFNRHCWGCHGPHPATKEKTMVEAPGKLKHSARMLAMDQAWGFKHQDKTFEHWNMTRLPVDDIGTDPNAALNFVNNRVDLSRTGLTTVDVQKLIQPLLEERLAREISVAPPAQKKEVEEKGHAAITQTLDAFNIKSVSIGEGLNIFGLMIRAQYRKDPRYAAYAAGLPPIQAGEGEDDDLFFAQIDLPQGWLEYKARPLAGAWATAPYLHNGSVPTLYQLLLPADRRDSKFWVGHRTFDPKHVGFARDPVFKGEFRLDTSLDGNHNTGHEFRAGYVNIYGDTAPLPPKEISACAETAPAEPKDLPHREKGSPPPPPQYGVIGPELAEEERWAIIEYLKIRQDPPTSNEFPDHCFCRANQHKP